MGPTPCAARTPHEWVDVDPGDQLLRQRHLNALARPVEHVEAEIGPVARGQLFPWIDWDMAIFFAISSRRGIVTDWRLAADR